MEVKQTKVSFSYQIGDREVLLQMFVKRDLLDFMWIYVGSNRYDQCYGDIKTSPMEMWPLAILSTLCEHEPTILNCPEILALRDYLLAQPGALRAGS